MYSMFTPIISRIYNANKGFIFEGSDGRKWKEDFDISNSDTTDEGELLYTFKEHMKTNHRSHKYYSGTVDSKAVFINIFRNGNEETLTISKDYHQAYVLYTFSKINPNLTPSDFQIWDRSHPGEKMSECLRIRDSRGPTEEDLQRILSPEWIYWDGTVMESFPAQINVCFLAEKIDEFLIIEKMIC